MPRSEDKFLVQVDSPGYGAVIRIASGKAESVHHIQNFACDCEGYHHRKDCSHIEMFLAIEKGDAVSPEKAWEITAKVLETMQPVCHRVWFDTSEVGPRGITKLKFKVELPFPKWKTIIAKFEDPGPLIEMEAV